MKNICLNDTKEQEIFILTNIKKWVDVEEQKQKLQNTIMKKKIPLIRKILKEIYNIELISGLKLKCCQCGSILHKNYSDIYHGYPCEICKHLYLGTSKQKNEILNFIKNILPVDIEIIQNCGSLIKNPDTNKFCEIDIYIPSLKIGFEYDGFYHPLKEYKDFKYHLNKTEECEKLGIQLIHIFEDEWILKRDIVKSRIKQILNANTSKRIHARKCEIIELSPQIKNNFLDKFHIQGKDSANIKLGALYINELVSVMTFSKGNISKGSGNKKGIWELNRFCSDSKYHIPGIAGKLLSYFKRNFEWEEIFSYADRRWSQGNLYHQLGFKLEHITQANYWYLKDFQKIHRFNLRKRPDEPRNVTEWTLRQQEGYTRVWDCGSLKFLTKKEI